MSPTVLESPTGEQPAAVITEKSRFSWPVVAVFVTLSFGAAGATALAAGADEKATEAKAAAASQAETLHAHDKRIQRVEDAQVAQKEALIRIEAKLDELRDAKRGGR